MKSKYMKALRNPEGTYGQPLDVLVDADLTQEEKRSVLEAWKAEAIHLQESSGEGFGGGERSSLDEIAKALSRV